MSLLTPEVHTALSQLLQGLQSGQNNVRSAAEEQLNNEWVVARPDVLLMGLVEQMQIQMSQDASVCFSMVRPMSDWTNQFRRYALLQQFFSDAFQRKRERIPELLSQGSFS